MELEPNFRWTDYPALYCPDCRAHVAEDLEPIWVNPMSKRRISEKRKSFIKWSKWLCDNPDGHFYIPYHDDNIRPLQYARGPWITGEMAEEDGQDYICAYLTTKVDTLGYTYGDVIADAYIDRGDDDKTIGDYFDFLVGGLDEYGCLDGKLISAPRELLRGRLKGDMVC